MPRARSIFRICTRRASLKRRFLLLIGLLALAPVITGAQETDATSESHYLYVAHDHENTISSYRVDPEAGAIHHNGYIMTGRQPMSITVHPSGKFAYASLFDDNAIAIYGIDLASGRLKEVSGSPIATEPGPSKLIISPSGNFAYVTNRRANKVSSFRIDPGTGLLSPSGTAKTGKEPRALMIHPNGQFAYVANFDSLKKKSSKLSIYGINPNTGKLKRSSTTKTGGNPATLAIHPSGKFLYLGSNGSKSIGVYAIDAKDGRLTETETKVIGDWPSALSIHPSGKFLYAGKNLAGKVSSFAINQQDGSLTHLNNVVVGRAPIAILTDPAGKFVYVINRVERTIAGFSVDVQTGELSNFEILRIRADAVAAAITTVTTPITRTSESTTAAKPPVGSGDSPATIAYERAGHFAFAPNANKGTVISYFINPKEGQLKKAQTKNVGGTPSGIAIHPSDKFVYVTNSTLKELAALAVDARTGQLSLITLFQAKTGTHPSAVAVTPTGRFAYVTNFVDNTVSLYRIVNDGSVRRMDADIYLPGLQDVKTGSNPNAIVVDPSSHFVYVANEGSSSVSIYEIDWWTGRLTHLADTPTPIRPTSVRVDPSGQWVYVTDQIHGQGGKQLTYAIDPRSGLLKAAKSSP